MSAAAWWSHDAQIHIVHEKAAIAFMLWFKTCSNAASFPSSSFLLSLFSSLDVRMMALWIRLHLNLIAYNKPYIIPHSHTWILMSILFGLFAFSFHSEREKTDKQIEHKMQNELFETKHSKYWSILNENLGNLSSFVNRKMNKFHQWIKICFDSIFTDYDNIETRSRHTLDNKFSLNIEKFVNQIHFSGL